MFKILEFIPKAIAWLRIVASPTLIAVIIGALIYFPNPGLVTQILAISIVVLGLFIGIAWANSVWKTRGTVEFMSRINATPELDNFNEEGKPIETKKKSSPTKSKVKK